MATSIGALVALTLPGSASAATVSVPCSTPALQAAITTANASAGPDTLNLAPVCLYVLDNTTGPLPDITDTLTIHGNTSTILRAPAAAAFRILTVRSALNLDIITLTGGNATGSSGGAIAVFAPGSLDLRNSFITNNTADNGGGLFTDGTMNVTNTVIVSNRASGSTGKGGGIANVMSGTVNVAQSLVAGNTAALAPGGIDNEGAGVSLTNSIVAGNIPTNCSPTPVPGCFN